jgi:broad specificity phosphatase PhoE
MEKSTTIFLVRHGQTDMNRDRIFRGRLDPPLNTLGHEEARAVAARLKGEPVSFVLSSPLLRATQTAEAIARLRNIGVRTVRELIDIDFGKWQGMSEKNVMKRHGRLLHQWQKEPLKVTFPGGESLLDVRKRMEVFLACLAAQFAGRTLAVVSHRVTLKALVSILAEIPPKNFWNIRIDTASVSIFEIAPDRTIVHCLNATSHLARVGDGRVLHDF